MAFKYLDEDPATRSWTEDKNPPKKKIVYLDEEPTRLESGLRGAAQGITFGGAPSLTAAARAPFSDKDLYTLLQEEQGKYERAEEAHPYVSGASEIASGIAPAIAAEVYSGGAATPVVAEMGVGRFIPKIARAVKSIYAPSTMKGMAATGGVIGGLKSKGIEEKDPLRVLEDIAQGTALGYAGGKYVAPIAGRVMQKTGELIERGASKVGLKGLSTLMSTLLGPSTEAIEARFTRNPEIAGAKHYEDLAQDLANGAKKLATEVHVLNEHAWAQLPDKPLMNVEDALGMVRELQGSLKVSGETVGGANAAANNKLEQYAENLTSIGKRTPYLKSTEVKQFLGSLDHDIDWDNMSPDVLTQSLRQLRGQMDSYLKSAHPDYAEVMTPLADKTRLLEEIKSKFGLRRGAGGEFEPSDITASKIKGITDLKKTYSRDILERYKGNVGEDIPKQAEDYRLAAQFERPTTQGSRKAVTYGAFGAGAGAWLAGTPGAAVGSAGGAMLGATMDIKGGEYAGKTIDFLVRNNPENLRQLIRMRPEAFGKYGPIIENSLKRGTAGFAASHFILQQNDPKYREMLENVDKDLKNEGEPTEAR